MYCPLAKLEPSLREAQKPVPPLPFAPLGIPCGPATNTSPNGSVAMLGSPPAGPPASLTGVVKYLVAPAAGANASSAATPERLPINFPRIENPSRVTSSISFDEAPLPWRLAEPNVASPRCSRVGQRLTPYPTSSRYSTSV